MARPATTQLLALVVLTVMAVLFGASFVATKHALAFIPPAQLIFLRFAVATGVFSLAAPFAPRARTDRRGYVGILLLALLEPGAYFFLEALGVQRTLASTAAVLISTIPVFVLVIETVVFKTRVVPREVAVIVASIGGIVLLVRGGGGPTLGGTLTGNLLVLGAALTAAAYTALAPVVIARHSPLLVSRVQSLCAAVLYLPLATREWLLGERPRLTWSAAGAVVYLAVGCSVVGYILLNLALTKVRASLVGAFSNVIPVVATVLAVVLLGERLLPMQLVGAIVVVGSLALLTWPQSKRMPATAGSAPRPADRPPAAATSG